jgi:hypothetical protein
MAQNPSWNECRRLWRYHSLGLVILAILALWIDLYWHSNPNSHLGTFFGNAIADWLGAWIILMVTKFLHERGSTQSRPFEDLATTPFTRFLSEHSLSLFLLICCTVSAVLFFRMDPASRWGAVAGNILSQFVQLLGLVLLTKKLFERNSK